MFFNFIKMAILKIIVEYKGKQIKKYIKLSNEELSQDSDIFILITNKHKIYVNYHFIYDIINETISIPETVCIPKETAIINMNLLFSNKSFVICPHCIGSLGQTFSRSLNLNVDIEF